MAFFFILMSLPFRRAVVPQPQPQLQMAYSQRRAEPIRVGLALGLPHKAKGEGRHVLKERWRGCLFLQTPLS